MEKKGIKASITLTGQVQVDDAISSNLTLLNARMSGDVVDGAKANILYEIKKHAQTLKVEDLRFEEVTFPETPKVQI